ncbi:MAG TPA: hypothetical protein VLZ73_06420, partial [Brevundimonas sp.]|nr:hypothetical protein [Brevundimonas sp.]
MAAQQKKTTEQPPLKAVSVEGPDGSAPVKKINKETLVALGQEFSKLFKQYASDRVLTEQRWLRNLRQYLGIYDPEVERTLAPSQSRAYPRITRVKCISMLSRIMNLMFQGNERNWALAASPSADMDPKDVKQAVLTLVQKRQEAGLETQPTQEIIDAAIQDLAEQRATQLSQLIDDQLMELGGDQTADYISLNRQVCMSGIRYGVGLMRGPFVREVKKTVWVPAEGGNYKTEERTLYKPQYDFLPVWDFYPDMSGRTLPGDGYFLRMVLTRSELRKLAKRDGYMEDQIKAIIKRFPNGNYKMQTFETELRTMGTTQHVDPTKAEPQGKFEIIVWNGPISAHKLEEVGADVPEDNMADDLEAELWMIGNDVIRADVNPWRKMGVCVKTIHSFVFDEDDTTPVGNGLPQVVRDSQMSICAATRMTLDNASITCGPNLEVNTGLLRLDQDLTSIEARKIWYRDDDQQTAQFPAVRRVEIDGHLPELQNLIQLFMGFADLETFVGPATGGDIQQAPSEPMRTAAGASMLRGDAALPFKDIVRQYDSFTQSVILGLVQFNRKFNPAIAPAGDYNVVARGATSLMAKEMRGIQVDQLAQTMRDEEWDHIDDRKFIDARLRTRDLEG